MTLSGKTYAISAGEHTATVVEVGAGLLHYGVGDTDVTCTYGADVLPPKCCGTTLVPWPNRLRDGRYTFDGVAQQLALTDPGSGNAIHGLGRWERWTKVKQAGDRVTLRLDVVPQKGYPFPLRVQSTYSLDPETGLTVKLEARNTGATRAPFGAGCHPFLATRGHRLDDVTLRLPARQGLVMEERQLPVGAQKLSGNDDWRRGRRLRTTRFDSCFTDLVTDNARGVAEIRTKSGGAQLWFDESFRFLQVFTVDELTPGQPGIAIEPMTCAPDAFNSGDGLIVLEPQQTWTGSWGIIPV